MILMKELLKELLSQVEVSILLSNQVNRKEFENIKADFPLREISSSFLQKNDGLKLLVVTEQEKQKMCLTYPNCIVISIEEIQQYLSQFYRLDDLSYTKLYMDSRYRMLSNHPEIQTIIAGGSTARSDFIESEMLMPTISLGITGLDMYYTLKSVEKALLCNPRIKMVIFPIHYISLFLSFHNSPNAIQQAVIHKILQPVFEETKPQNQLKQFPDWELKYDPVFDQIVSPDKFCMEYDARIVDKLIHLPYYNDQFFKRPPNGQNAYCFREKATEFNNRAAEILTEMQEQLFSKQNSRDGVTYFENLLKFLQQKKISLLAVVPPVTDYYRKASGQKYYDFFYQTAVPILKKYGYALLDYYDSDLFTHEDYVDYDHLNEQGAIKLSKLVSAYLEKEKI